MMACFQRDNSCKNGHRGKLGAHHSWTLSAAAILSIVALRFLPFFIDPAGGCEIVVEPSAPSMEENSPAGTVLASLQLNNSDPGDVLSYVRPVGLTLNANNELVVEDPGVADVETDTNFPTITVRISADCTDTDITVSVLDANEAPTDILFDGQAVPAPLSTDDGCIPFPEGNATHTIALNTVDEDIGQGHTYSLGGPDAGRFVIAGDDHVGVASALDFESEKHTFDINITSTDHAYTGQHGGAVAGGLSITRSICIQTQDVNEAPAFAQHTIDITATTILGHAFEVALPASDPDTPATLTYSIVNATRANSTSGDGVAAVGAELVQTPWAGGALLLLVRNLTVGQQGVVLYVRVQDDGGLDDVAMVRLNLTVLPVPPTTTTTYALFTTTATATATTTTTTTKTTATTTTTGTRAANTTSNGVGAATSSSSWTDNGGTIAGVMVALVLVLLLIVFIVRITNATRTATLQHKRFATTMAFSPLSMDHGHSSRRSSGERSSEERSSGSGYDSEDDASSVASGGSEVHMGGVHSRPPLNPDKQLLPPSRVPAPAPAHAVMALLDRRAENNSDNDDDDGGDDDQ